MTVDPQKLNLQALPTLALTERTQLPNSAAIYFVLDAQQAVHYVGRAKSLCFRWHTHHRIEDFKKIPDTRIAYLIVTEVNLLNDIERALIEYFDPPLNYNRPSLGNIEQLTVRFPKSLLTVLRQIAQENHHSLNTEIVLAARDRARQMAGTAS